MRKPIAYGDVKTQAVFMTGHMRDVLRLIERGDLRYGRVIAKELKVPFPQAYRTLNVLAARGYLAYEYGEPGSADAKRKLYYLTPIGLELWNAVRDMEITRAPKFSAPQDRDPDAYARRMRVTTVTKWLTDLGLVDSYEELEHVSTCAQCTDLIKIYGLKGDVRCQAYADSRNGTT